MTVKRLKYELSIKLLPANFLKEEEDIIFDYVSYFNSLDDLRESLSNFFRNVDFGLCKSAEKSFYSDKEYSIVERKYYFSDRVFGYYGASDVIVTVKELLKGLKSEIYDSYTFMSYISDFHPDNFARGLYTMLDYVAYKSDYSSDKLLFSKFVKIYDSFREEFFSKTSFNPEYNFVLT